MASPEQGTEEEMVDIEGLLREPGKKKRWWWTVKEHLSHPETWADGRKL